MNDLLLNIDKLHTTKMGIERLSRNLNIDCDVVLFCKDKIMDKNCYLVYVEHGINNVLKEKMFKNSDCLFYNDNMAFVKAEENVMEYWGKYLSTVNGDNFVTRIDITQENLSMWGMLNKKVWRFLGILTDEEKENKDEHSTSSTRQ